jgi:hypothetical protein
MCHIYLHSYLQTLTGLYIANNKITQIGAQHLATALRDNKVIILISSLPLSCSLSSQFVDTQRAINWRKSNWSWWSSTFRCYVTRQQGGSHHFLFTCCSHLSLSLFVDTHHIAYRKRWNWRCWCTISRCCIAR